MLKLVHLISTVIVLFSFHSCKFKKMAASGENTNVSTNRLHKPGSTYKDSLFILSPAAIFFSPDSLQLKSIQEMTEPAVFEGSMHEYFYQQRNARQYLRLHWNNIVIMEAMNCRYLVFRKGNGSVIITDLDKEDPCGMFVFDRVKDPQLIDMTNVDTQVADYFENGKHE